MAFEDDEWDLLHLHWDDLPRVFGEHWPDLVRAMRRADASGGSPLPSTTLRRLASHLAENRPHFVEDEPRFARSKRQERIIDLQVDEFPSGLQVTGERGTIAVGESLTLELTAEPPLLGRTELAIHVKAVDDNGGVTHLVDALDGLTKHVRELSCRTAGKFELMLTLVTGERVICRRPRRFEVVEAGV